MRAAAALTFAVLSLAACARQANDAELRAHFAKGETSPKNDGGFYPTPYSAEQIRDATKPGRTYRFKIETAGNPPGERLMTFTKVDAEGAEISTNGEPAKRVTWEELRKHAEFPKPVVSTREERITLPAGTFDCVVYVVQGEPGETRTFYFAKSLPGAPVFFFTIKDGKSVMTSTLVEHRPGK